MSQMDSDVAAQREKILTDLYAEAGSMLEGMGKKRKLGTRRTEDEGDQEDESPLGKLLNSSSADPLKSAYKDINTVMADQDAVLSADPVISSIKLPKQGGGAAWKRKIYETARATSARKPYSSSGNDVGQVATGLWNQAKADVSG